MVKSVCVVGCGWFGLSLAKTLVNQGLAVNGTRRSQIDANALSQLGIKGTAVDLSLTEELNRNQVEIQTALNTDCLVVCIPPGFRKDADGYLTKLARLVELIKDIAYQKVIFISTTGVYPPVDRLMTECDATAYSDKSNKLLKAEAMFAKMSNSCVVRFAGLVGPKRHPGRFLAGKIDLAQPNAPVNVVHLNDCIAAVSKLMFEASTYGIYNVCAPLHPTRRAFYQQASDDLGLTAPLFIDDAIGGKLISSERLIKEFNFEFQFSNPTDMLSAC
ncbi:SDR family oxidoreductase [Shewanella youngdeokensis]|uniref:SDR family oxidoreductase n=1 Tax=Shewanella youngdeokensis TaxID=2999068 RepID=A0ABZ0JWH1_9GAMM|nr:SDR family oxidoreductase [Shewanella sp. DAU334]